MIEVRLNKYLSDRGICSRREADRLIEQGQVWVDHHQAAMGQKVTGREEIRVRDKVLAEEKKLPAPVWLLVNKPRGIVSTTSTKDRAKNIVELVNYPERIYPVGRLDKDSQGLILMTNQGDLVNKIMRAQNAHEKEYIVRVDKRIQKDFAEKMKQGVYLRELQQTTRPAKVRILDHHTFSIILTQGLNRQIRRMCEALGCRVVSLTRIRIMNLLLGELKPGTFRPMTGAEYQQLTAMLKAGNSSNIPAKDRNRQDRRKSHERKNPADERVN